MTDADDAALEAAKDIAAGRSEPEPAPQTDGWQATPISLSEAPPEILAALRAAGIPIGDDDQDEDVEPETEALRQRLVARHAAQIRQEFDGTSEDALARAILYAELTELYGGSPHTIATLTAQGQLWAAVADGIDMQDATVTAAADMVARELYGSPRPGKPREELTAQGTLAHVRAIVRRLGASGLVKLGPENPDGSATLLVDDGYRASSIATSPEETDVWKGLAND